MKSILLTTINAKYIHTSIGLRYLYANMYELQDETSIVEFSLSESINAIAEKILQHKPKILGIGVYIWNGFEVLKLVNLLKKIEPGIKIILGGPEVSHNPLRLDFKNADYIIQGEGEISFYKLCRSILAGHYPPTKIISAEYVDPKSIELPYAFYTEEEIKNKVIYVEASRGCPFKCEFCLSSIDKTVRYFDLDKIISALDSLWERGVRKFKFIDRTFNLELNTAGRLLDYFLQKDSPYFVHFEVVPENFPDSLKEKLKLFPPASLQLEIGLQTLNPVIAQNISRPLNIKKIKENLTFLGEETNAHLHIDLIIGLPGESVESFAGNLNSLMKMTGAEVQLGVLKKLSGTAISRHDENFEMLYSDLPPYEIMQTNLIPFTEMQKLKRLSRYWDLTYNSGNFNNTIKLLWEDDNVYKNFNNFSEWIYSRTGVTSNISLNRLAELFFEYLTSSMKRDEEETADALVKDIINVPGRKVPSFLKQYISFIPESKLDKINNLNKRQVKHKL